MIKFLNFSKNRITKAFTLTEMLMAMMILGTIAALLTPVLVVAPSQQVFKKEYKKIYEEVDAATMILVRLHGYSLNGACGVMENPHNCLRDMYRETYPSYLKSCDDGTTFGSCWSKASEYYRMDRQHLGFPNTSGFVTPDGAFLYFISYQPYCSTKINWANGIEPCGIIMIDVNGFGMPNKVGRDIYSVWLLKDRLLPFGSEIDGFKDDFTKTGWGYSMKNLYN